MVSSSHEAMHRIFQHDPGLFSRVTHFLGIDLPRPIGATALPTDLTEASPVERRVDTLRRSAGCPQPSWSSARTTPRRNGRSGR